MRELTIDQIYNTAGRGLEASPAQYNYEAFQKFERFGFHWLISENPTGEPWEVVARLAPNEYDMSAIISKCHDTFYFLIGSALVVKKVVTSDLALACSIAAVEISEETEKAIARSEAVLNR